MRSLLILQAVWQSVESPQQTACVGLRGREKKAGNLKLPAYDPKQKMRPTAAQKLFKFLGHHRELQLRLRQRLYDDGFRALRTGVSRRGHLADQQILRAF
jgi:hypothetical protein